MQYELKRLFVKNKALIMIEEGMDIQKVSRITALSIEVIGSLRKGVE